MKAEVKQILDEVLGIDLNSCDVQLCLASLLKGDIPEFQRVTISKDIAQEFRNVVVNALVKRKRETENGDLVLHQYDAISKLDPHEIEYIKLDQHKSIQAQIESLSKLPALNVFREEKDFVANLRFYVILLTPGNGKAIYLFRSYTPRMQLSRSKKFAIMMRNGQYDRCEDNLFLFDRGIDCMVCDGYLFIFGKDMFQKIFQFYEVLIKTARTTLKTIKAHIPIDDFDAFEQACEGHLQKIAKLKNIASKPYLKDLTLTDIKKAIQKYKLPIKTTGTGKNEKLHFDASDKWAILRLLDDDYLESVMTGKRYEVNSKRSL